MFIQYLSQMNKIINEIVKDTNMCASQVLLFSTLTRKSRLRDWVPSDRSNMKEIIGIFPLQIMYYGIELSDLNGT